MGLRCAAPRALCIQHPRRMQPSGTGWGLHGLTAPGYQLWSRREEREPGVGHVGEELSPLQASPDTAGELGREGKGSRGHRYLPLSIKSSQSLPPCSFCIINSPWGWNKLWARLDISLHLVSHQVVLAGLQPVDELVNEC